MSTPLFIALTAVAVVVEIIFVPLFLKAQRPGICVKSFCFKMICATMFIALGLLSWKYSGNTSQFAKFMLIGLLLSWFGDLFLHLKLSAKSKTLTFAIGFCFFMSAHVLYLIAFSKAWKQYFPEKSYVSVIDIALFAVIFLLAFLFVRFVKKLPLKGIGVPVSAGYGIFLVSMFVKAATFSINYIIDMGTAAIPGAVCLTFGAFCFLLSDASLALLMFNPADKGRIGLKNHNIGTYFMAQTLLALSIIFVGII